jgi:hypothetical protein
MQLRRWLKGSTEVAGGNQQKKHHLKHPHEYLAVLRAVEAPTCKLAEVVSWPDPTIAKKFVI